MDVPIPLVFQINVDRGLGSFSYLLTPPFCKTQVELLFIEQTKKDRKKRKNWLLIAADYAKFSRCQRFWADQLVDYPHSSQVACSLGSLGNEKTFGDSLILLLAA